MTDDGKTPQLPMGWMILPLGNFIECIEAGANFKCEERPPHDEETGVAKISAVTWGEYDEDESKTCRDVARIAPNLLIAPGDFLFSRANTISLVGACVIARRVTRRVMLSDKILRLRLRGVEPAWVLYFLRSAVGRSHIERLATGNQESMRNIGQDRIRSIPVPIAPRVEQQRTIAAIEQHLSDIDAGVASLERVLANLKRYRASVLKDACEGRLVPTEAELARKEGREYEPGDVLLRRILDERRARWEADQLAKMSAKGQVPRDERWKAKYEEPKKPDRSELPKLPEGWAWAKLGSVADVQLGQQRAPVHAAAEVTYPYVRAANITWRGLDLSDVKQMGFPDPDRYRLEPGDVLLSEASGSPSEVGKPAIWRGEIPGCCYQKTLLRVRSYCSELLPEWLHLGFMRDALSGRFAKMAPGVGILHLTAERMLEWPVLIAPVAEQRRILAEVARLLSITDEMDRVVDVQLARARRLRQSVLKSAFEGKLVPQDPNDEPASALLDRLRTARAQASAANGSGRTSRRGRAKVLQADEGGLDDG
ncbi:hypothetical protein [Sorangium cellulosum]|uniref:restriction endonuclease subunit S n=1 Tax=Sorangium cellulosum TaxID=56 RepID=UPI000A8DBA57|nr:hypothetical protein [Sorangium cellulosum]